MEQEMLNALALVRFERAQELVAEAKDLLTEKDLSQPITELIMQ